MKEEIVNETFAFYNIHSNHTYNLNIYWTLLMFVSSVFFGKSFFLIESYKAPGENCHNKENQP